MRTVLLLLAALVAFPACGGDEAAETVAMNFWQAAVERDFDAAEPLSTAADEADVEEFLGSFAPKDSPAIGDALTGEERALVETIFLIDSGREPLKFHTQLVVNDGEWRVDLDATGQELRRARIDIGIERAKEALAEAKAETSSRASAQAAAEKVHEAADAIEQALSDESPGETSE